MVSIPWSLHTNLICEVPIRPKTGSEFHFPFYYRAVNNGLLDTYQLKSLDGILEADVKHMIIKEKNGMKSVSFLDDASKFDNFAMRDQYDVVIRCLGFTFDHSIFSRYEMLIRVLMETERLSFITLRPDLNGWHLQTFHNEFLMGKVFTPWAFIWKGYCPCLYLSVCLSFHPFVNLTLSAR